MRRFAPIVFALTIVSFLAVHVSHAGNNWQKGLSAGNNLGNSVLNSVGSKRGINDRFSKPLTSSDTEMQYFGGAVYECSTTHTTYTSLKECQSHCSGTCSQKNGFGAQLTAPSSKSFLEVFIQPGPTGDINTVILKQDTNYDGSYDYVYTLPVRVSGVCANGIISCDAGTWQNCKYYTWTANKDKKVSLSQVPSIESLGGCYCINSSCGSNLVWNNLSTVLEDLGGGAVGAVQKTDPHFTVTNAKIQDTSIVYYGQETSSAGYDLNTGLPTSGKAHPEEYYSNPSQMSADADTEVLSQKANPDSYYSQLVNSPVANQKDVSEYTCEVRHDVVIKQKTEEISKSGSGTWNTDDRLYIRIVKDGNKVRFQWIDTGPDGIGGSHGVCWNSCGPCDWTDVDSFDLSSLPANSKVTGYYFRASYSGAGCTGGSGTAEFLNQTVKLTNACGANGCQSPTVNWQYYVEYTHDIPQFTTTGSCNPADNCRLKEEKVCDWNGKSCVYTWRNFNPTGLSPLPSCKTITTDIDTYTVCMDGSSAVVNSSSSSKVIGSGSNIWWRVERVYQCESKDKYDFSSIKKRVSHIQSTVKDDSGSMYYEDYNPKTGETISDTTSLPDMGSYDTCEKFCKLRKSVQNTDAGVSGNRSQYQNSTQSYEYIYRKCQNGKCPVQAGEEIVEDCQCINEFSQAATYMQVLDNASKDLICSSSPPD